MRVRFLSEAQFFINRTSQFRPVVINLTVKKKTKSASTLETAQDRKNRAPKEDQTHFSIVTDLARQTCQTLHHVEVPVMIFQA